MMIARTAYIFFIVFILLTPSLVSQRSLAIQTEPYSPQGAKFSMEVPRTPSPSQNRVFDSNADAFVYGLIEKGKPKVYNFEMKRDKRQLFLVSILQISFVGRKSPKYLTQKQIDTINTLIHDDISVSDPIKAVEGRTKTTQWSYQDALTGDGDIKGLIVAKFTPRNLFVIVVIANYGKIAAPEIKKMLASFTEKS